MESKFPMESFAFFRVECQNEADGVASERYFRMASDIDFIGSYFYRAGTSTEPQLSTIIPRASCATFHQQHIIDIYFVEIPFWKIYYEKSTSHNISLKSEIFND